MRYDSTRPVAPPRRDEEAEPVSWPPPPPDVSRPEATETPEERDPWRSDWDPANGSREPEAAEMADAPEAEREPEPEQK
jgi:hypothetical protein